MKHILAVDQFERPWLEGLFAEADRMRALPRDAAPQRGKILATIFYEPSTRTRLSFESAMIRLGGNVVSTENAREFSSAIKGETVEDTMRMVSGYADAIAMRHHEEGAIARAVSVSDVPILNAGDGPGEHPTQALLDLYTIHHEIGQIDDLNIVMVGDLKYGRTVRSLSLLLRQTNNCKITFVAPDAVRMRDDIKDALDASGVLWHEEADLHAAMEGADVVYQTRIQKERFASEADYLAVKGTYVIDAEAMTHLPQHGIIMHPLPRVDEIAVEVDNDPRAAYFRQARNGVYVRMALLNQVLS
ncbi:MAG: aspartate carbamoyltransferase [Thermomicrobiales bacterium]|nr:aspartate carbamoyltransferase [Thermomicrobiales bacterium]